MVFAHCVVKVLGDPLRIVVALVVPGACGVGSFRGAITTGAVADVFIARAAYSAKPCCTVARVECCRCVFSLTQVIDPHTDVHWSCELAVVFHEMNRCPIAAVARFSRAAVACSIDSTVFMAVCCRDN